MTWAKVTEDPLCALTSAISDKKQKYKEKKTMKHQSKAAEADRAAGQPSQVGRKSMSDEEEEKYEEEKYEEEKHEASAADEDQSEPGSVETMKHTGELARTAANPAQTVVIEGHRLYAISDIHLSYKSNVDFWANLAPHPDDGLILAGDVGETEEHLELAFSTARRCFRQVWWTVGNHELYSVSGKAATGEAVEEKVVARGQHKYEACVEIARRYGVLTPEDDFVAWKSAASTVIVAPVFTLYDYSFAPDGISSDKALAWAQEEDVIATDEALLHPDPYPTKQAWCAALVSKFEQKLELTVQQNPGVPLVLVNHWPLRRDTLKLFRYPRFIIWCGTRKTEDWHTRFNAQVVVTGHIHIRRTDWREGASSCTRFEEVSMGYPREWKDAAATGASINSLLREIVPGPAPPKKLPSETRFRRYG